MRIWQTKSLVTHLLPAIVIVALLGSGMSSAQAADDHAHVKHGKPLHGPAAEVQNVVDQAVGVVPKGEDSHAIDYMQPPLLPQMPLFIFTLVLFGGFVLLMRSVVWNPLISSLDARELRITNAESEARAARVEVEKLTAQAEKRLAEVYSEVKTIVAKARAEAEATKLEIVSKAEADAQRIKREALAAIAQARTAALAELDQTVEQQVSLATTHVAGRQL